MRQGRPPAPPARCEPADGDDGFGNYEASMTGKSDIGAMTVNERLVHFGLFPRFEAAVKARDKAAIVAVLVEAGFTPQQAEYTTSMLLSAPSRYGY
jgi:hypothetical protein